jgi:branched-chain amino acid aminotransferase
MNEPIAYIRGEYVPASQCTLPVYDLGITNGVAVTDLVRTFGQKLYRLEDHVRRFYRSCKYAYIEPPVSYEQSLSISEKLIAENSKKAPGKELGLIYYITGGQVAAYAGWTDLSKQGTPTYVQHTFLLRPDSHRDIFLNGVHCITPAARHWPPQCLSSKIKNRNRLHMWIGQQQVRLADPQAMPLYLDIDGNISETGGSNFVIYRDGAVISPRRNNILWGISLTVLGEILEEMGIPLLEQDIQIYDVVNADEAWVPSTPYCLGPVVKLNGTEIGDGRPGPMWRRVLDRWSQIVGKDIYREFVDAEAP